MSLVSGLYPFTTSAILALSAPGLAESLISNVSSIESLSQISVDQPPKTLFLFDLDDTIFDSFSMLGSKAWRRYIVEATKRMDGSTNWHDVFSYLLAQKHPVKTVEEMTSSFVQDLQAKGFVVCGLTSRERKRWYDTPQEGVDLLTVKQLSTVGVDFHNGALENTYAELSGDSEYFKGIFFANLESKGEYLLHLFDSITHLPEKIIFVDDKLSQVESVEKALTQLGIPHECYLYSATNKKEKSFSPVIANIQLYQFCESDGQVIISDAEAEQIARNNPEKNGDYYFNLTLQFLKSG